MYAILNEGDVGIAHYSWIAHKIITLMGRMNESAVCAQSYSSETRIITSTFMMSEDEGIFLYDYCESSMSM